MVKTQLNACGGHTKPSVKNLAHTVLATSVEIRKTRLWNTQAQIISAIYESTFPCLHELSGQYILGEVFLYSNCDIYDTQTTTNQIGTLHLSYCLSRKIGGHLEFCILKPGVHQNCNLHIKNWLSTLKICKMHVSHKLILQLICLAMVHSLQNGGHLEFGILKATMYSKCEIHNTNQPSTLKIYIISIKGMHFTRLCDNYIHDYGSPGKVAAIFDLCKWGRKNAPMTCVLILNHLVCKEVCICQIICFYPNVQYQALFELLTAPLCTLFVTGHHVKTV